MATGFVTCMTPPYRHISLLVLLSAGRFSINTLGEPGAHGKATAGTHGAGVKTPSAAAVAEATAGLDGVPHMPNVMNSLSIIVAANRLQAKTVDCDSTMSGHGATPNEQTHSAVISV